MIGRHLRLTAIISGLGSLGSLGSLGNAAMAAPPTVTAPTALAVSIVTTGGTAVTAIPANSAPNGCYIQNDPLSTINLVIDPVSTANASTPTGTSSILLPGNTWSCPFNSQIAVSVNATDSGHKFYGIRY